MDVRAFQRDYLDRAGVIDGLAGTMTESGIGILGALYSLAVLLPSLAVQVRRLHDTGRSGWWWLIAFVPCVGPIVLLVFFVMDSQEGTNEYGPNPKSIAV